MEQLLVLAIEQPYWLPFHKLLTSFIAPLVFNEGPVCLRSGLSAPQKSRKGATPKGKSGTGLNEVREDKERPFGGGGLW